MKNLKIKLIASTLLLGLTTTANAQINAEDSVMNHSGGNKFSIGGYGEVTYSRMFYSDNVYRYSNPAKYKNDPSHGEFDIPHVVLYLGYDFGKGWSMGSEIEFEHGGNGVAYEKEYEESGEWEQEVEKGGEVGIEQFWLQKSFCSALNLRLGHLVVPFGLTNAQHEPLKFFTVYRPEGEATIFPCTWNQTGISLSGSLGSNWEYELQFLAGLNALSFSRDNWIQGGASSAFEYEPANKYAVSLRVGNYSVPGLRMAVSGYYGKSIDNTLGRDANGNAAKLSGIVALGSFDFTFNRFNWVVRGNIDYGYLGDADDIRTLAGRQTDTSPFNQDYVGKNAIATGIEAGYDIFSQIEKIRNAKQKLFLFGRYEYYNSYIPTSNQPKFNYTKRNRWAFGLNYYPIPQIAIKADYSIRALQKPYNNEPSLNIGIAYEGFFL